MAAGEAPIKQAVQWIDDQLRDDPKADRAKLVDEARRRVQEQFGASAQAYVQSAGHAGGPDLEQLVAWGRARAPARVLDVATGAGHTAPASAAPAPPAGAFHQLQK